MKIAFVFCAAAAFGVAAAQTVYEAQGERGKIYSDQPLPGGKPVKLRPLSVIEAKPAPVANPAVNPAAQTAAHPADAVPAYRSLTVAFPEEGGSVAANNATIEVRVSIDPPLQIGRGHALALRLDGRAVPGRYTTTEMAIPPAFFGDTPPAGVQQHVLEVSVVDADGRLLLAAAPVNFQTRFMTVLQRPRPQPPAPPAPPAAPATDSRPAVEPRR